MIYRIRYGLAVLPCALWVLTSPAVLEAQLSTPDRRAAEKMMAGVLYLRLDVPCDYGRMVPMLEVSPDGADSSRKIADLSRENRENVYWLFGPNDTVQSVSLRWGIDSVRVWGEASRFKRNELMIDFVRIKSLEDFKKAFDRAFSRVPLQDAHPEWSPEVRKAVAERRLVEGMTKEQATAVVGTPLSVETSGAEGSEIELWRLRPIRGKERSYWGVSTLTGFPPSLKFQSGKLAVIEQTPSPAAPWQAVAAKTGLTASFLSRA